MESVRGLVSDSIGDDDDDAGNERLGIRLGTQGHPIVAASHFFFPAAPAVR
jgi:hypothetical protein